jgi:hypothetical protein
MASRLELHEVLCEILGSRNVYFQPPESVKMQYPAIVYSRRSIDNIHANNSVYMLNNSYELTLIHRDPDNDIVEKLAKLQTCKFDRHFVSDNLNHYTYTLYF